jgi:hypothetical protein
LMCKLTLPEALWASHLFSAFCLLLSS